MNSKKTESIHKELDFIENIISRMANNSFLLKSWAITIFVALITFFNLKNLSDTILIIALFTIIFLFGYLDAFYLMMERKYTSLYSHVRKQRIEDKIFDNQFDLNAEKYNNETVWDVIINLKYQKKFIKDYIKKNHNNLKLDKKIKRKIKKDAFLAGFRRNTIALFYTAFLFFILLYTGYAIFNYCTNNIDQQKKSYEVTIKEANISISELDEKITLLKTNIEQLISKKETSDENINKLKYEISSINKQINIIIDNQKNIQTLLNIHSNTSEQNILNE